MNQIRCLLVVSTATPPQSEFRARVAELIRKFGAEPNLKDKMNISAMRGEPPGPKQFSDILTETFSQGIWNEQTFRVRNRVFDDPVFGRGRMGIVVEGDFTTGPETTCPTCGVHLRLDTSSDGRAFECTGIGCSKIYCDKHSPQGAKCSCGCGIRMSKVRYPDGHVSQPSSPQIERPLTSTDIVHETPTLIKVMIPGGYIGIEFHNEADARDAASQLTTWVKWQKINLVGPTTGVSIPMVEGLLKHMQASFPFFRTTKRVYVAS